MISQKKRKEEWDKGKKEGRKDGRKEGIESSVAWGAFCILSHRVKQEADKWEKAYIPCYEINTLF
jgi:hypothetical protein